MSGIQLVDFLQRSYPVVGVQVTKKNVDAVAAWCGGKVKNVTPPDAPENVLVVEVQVLNHKNRITYPLAEVGDWIVREPHAARFKVYTPLIAERELVETDIHGSPNRIRRQAGLPEPKLEKNVSNHDKIVELVKQAMEFQDLLTMKGANLGEGYGAAKFVATQIEKLFT